MSKAPKAGTELPHVEPCRQANEAIRTLNRLDAEQRAKDQGTPYSGPGWWAIQSGYAVVPPDLNRRMQRTASALHSLLKMSERDSELRAMAEDFEDGEAGDMPLNPMDAAGLRIAATELADQLVLMLEGLHLEADGLNKSAFKV